MFFCSWWIISAAWKRRWRGVVFRFGWRLRWYKIWVAQAMKSVSEISFTQQFLSLYMASTNSWEMCLIFCHKDVPKFVHRQHKHMESNNCGILRVYLFFKKKKKKAKRKTGGHHKPLKGDLLILFPTQCLSEGSFSFLLGLKPQGINDKCSFHLDWWTHQHSPGTWFVLGDGDLLLLKKVFGHQAHVSSQVTKETNNHLVLH